MRSRYSSSSVWLGNEVAYTRVSIGFFSLPRQYAPATDSNLTRPMLPVLRTCGPRHRSMKSRS